MERSSLIHESRGEDSPVPGLLLSRPRHRQVVQEPQDSDDDNHPDDDRPVLGGELIEPLARLSWHVPREPRMVMLCGSLSPARALRWPKPAAVATTGTTTQARHQISTDE